MYFLTYSVCEHREIDIL